MVDESSVTVSRDYLSDLEKKVHDLKTLIEVSSIISSTLDFDDLISLVMEKAKNVMDAEACSILLYDKTKNKLEFALALCRDDISSDTLKDRVSLDMGQGIAGWVAQQLKPLLIEDARTDKRFYREADRLTGFETKSIIAAPLIGRSGLVGVAELLNPKNKKQFDSYDAEIFQTYCRQIAVAIENATFHRAAVEREKFKREMEIASAVQKSFLREPPVLSKGSMRVSAINLSASQVGGDIYDFVELDNGKVGVLIGDVSGKGVSAALYMAKVISEFRNIVTITKSPAEALSRINTQVLSAPRGMFLTCIYLTADTSSGSIEVSVAGHPPFLRLSSGGLKVISLPSGPPLGIIEGGYPVSTLSMNRGDKLILLTDGVYDAKNAKGTRLGFSKVTRMVEENAREKDIIHIIADYVNDYSKEVNRADDLTLVQIDMN